MIFTTMYVYRLVGGESAALLLLHCFVSVQVFTRCILGMSTLTSRCLHPPGDCQIDILPPGVLFTSYMVCWDPFAL